MLEVKIFTLYPDLFPGPLDLGIFKKAKENKTWNLKVINIRDYTKDNYGKVDDTPFGGGSGMLLRPDILASALDENVKKGEDNNLEWLPYERTISFRQCQASEGGYFQSYHLRKGLLKGRPIALSRRLSGYPLRREGTSSPR